MSARNHDLKHTPWYAAYVIDVDAKALSDTVMFSGDFLTRRHDSLYTLCFIEIEEPAANWIFAGEYAEADFTNPIFELVVEMFMFSFADALQYNLLGRLCWNACEDIR